jgi:hypothetical protein
MKTANSLEIAFEPFAWAAERLMQRYIFLGLLWVAITSPLFALGPNLYVHSECLFCPSSYDRTTVTVNLELGGSSYVDGHYVVMQCDNNGFNCHNHDFTITNNTITSGATYTLLFTALATPGPR